MQEYFLVLLLAAMPISELRGAIPVALGLFEFSPAKAYLFGVVGNLLPVAFLLWTVPKCIDYFARRLEFVRNFFEWYFTRIEKQHSLKFKKWGKLALIILVAIPLPLTGVWTGSLAAFLFRIPFFQAFSMITVGVLIAGALVLGGSLGILNSI